jgi:hypothetical protein
MELSDLDLYDLNKKTQFYPILAKSYSHRNEKKYSL